MTEGGQTFMLQNNFGELHTKSKKSNGSDDKSVRRKTVLKRPQDYYKCHKFRLRASNNFNHYEKKRAFNYEGFVLNDWRGVGIHGH